jgi:hypothetical protein
MSRYDDIDSPDYECFSAGGDGRRTPEEREVERLERENLKLTVQRAELAGHLRCFVAIMKGRTEGMTPTVENLCKESEDAMRRMKLR